MKLTKDQIKALANKISKGRQKILDNLIEEECKKKLIIAKGKGLYTKYTKTIKEIDMVVNNANELSKYCSIHTTYGIGSSNRRNYDQDHFIKSVARNSVNKKFNLSLYGHVIADEIHLALIDAKDLEEIEKRLLNTK